jgi:nanoRNase/pAp phosphatase (c-di-AMP/oligoRNAs hydrolase)
MKHGNKYEIKNIAEKNRITLNIIHELLNKKSFLLLGHKNPDEDCIASMVAFALLISKYGKDVTIFLVDPVVEQLDYLLAICKYNDINVVRNPNEELNDDFSALIVLDTPKSSMLMVNDKISALLEDPAVRKIELDHHLGSDSRYIGDEGFCLVSQASSTCELIGYLSMKLARRVEREERLPQFFNRNIALAILTGIVGDSQMGKYLKTNKERWYYRIFSAIFESLLKEKTVLGSRNMASMQDIFNVIRSISRKERKCFKEMEKHLRKSPSIYAICIEREPSEALFGCYGGEVVVNAAKAAADKLAEESGKLGLIAYYDDPALSGMVQFRLRRSAWFTALDLRTVLEKLDIANGGGHPGAVGFRVKKDEVPNLYAYMGELMARIEEFVTAI